MIKNYIYLIQSIRKLLLFIILTIFFFFILISFPIFLKFNKEKSLLLITHIPNSIEALNNSKANYG
jgi:hypothetical protein